MDLIQTIRTALNEQVINRIASALGIDASAAMRAIETALPAIMGGMVQQASNPTGAANLFGALDKVDTGMLDNLGASLSGGNAQSMIETGNKLLPSIFGANYSGVISTLGKLTGLGTGKICPQLGMLAPIVDGFVSKIVKSSGAGLAGFTQLLLDQKKNLAGLDPAVTNQLGLGSVPTAAKPTMQAASKPMQTGAGFAREMATSTAGSSSIGKWLIPVLALAAVGVALYIYVFSPDRGDMTPKNLDPSKFNQPEEGGAGLPTPGGASGKAGKKEGESSDADKGSEKSETGSDTKSKADKEPASASDAGKAVIELLTDARKAFAEVKDEATAKSAAEVWQGLAKKVDGLDFEKMGQTTKLVIAPAIAKFVEEAKAWAEKAYANPEVKSILEPAVNAVVDKLKGFAE
jgi:hypothetical protein